MSKYSDIVKKVSVQAQPVCGEFGQPAVVDEKPKYVISRPPKKSGNCSYDRWEYSYFPYLIEMYKILCEEDDETKWDSKLMHHFFRFIYDVSSGEISRYLNELSEEQYELYSEYLIKRNQL